MSRLLFDDEDYYFQINEALEDDKQFVLIIYDIVDNKKRIKFSKMLEGYGKRCRNLLLRRCFHPKVTIN